MENAFAFARVVARFAFEAAYHVIDDFDHYYFVKVTQNGDQLRTANTFGSMESKRLRGLRHVACGRKVTIQKIGRVGFLWGHTGTAIFCKHCSFRIEVPARVRTVNDLRNHFSRFNPP